MMTMLTLPGSRPWSDLQRKIDMRTGPWTCWFLPSSGDSRVPTNGRHEREEGGGEDQLAVVGRDLEEQYLLGSCRDQDPNLAGAGGSASEGDDRGLHCDPDDGLGNVPKTKSQAGGITRHHKPSCCSCSAGEEGCL